MKNWILVGMKSSAFDKKMLIKEMINLLFSYKKNLNLLYPLIPISTFSNVNKKK